MTLTMEGKGGDAGAAFSVEVFPNGEIVTIRHGNEARMRIGAEALAKLAASLERMPTYYAPPVDYDDSKLQSVAGSEVLLTYPNDTKLFAYGPLSSDVPRRARDLIEWLRFIEVKR